MADLIDLETNKVMLKEPVKLPIPPEKQNLSVLEVYAAWAQELGLESTGSDGSLTGGDINGDDLVYTLSTPFSPLLNGKNFITLSSENSVNLYTQQPISAGSSRSNNKKVFYIKENKINSLARMYFSGETYPALTITVNTDDIADSESKNGKIRFTNSAIIYYTEWFERSASSNLINFAMRINKDQSIEIYVSCAGDNPVTLSYLPMYSSVDMANDNVISGGNKKHFTAQVGEVIRVKNGSMLGTKITGKVTLDDSPFSSNLVVTSVEDTPKVVGIGKSDGTGQYSIGTGTYNGPVLIHSIQDFGVEWAKNMTLNAGDIVRPTTVKGYLFKVKTPGVTGSIEPTWPEAPGSIVSDGEVGYTSETLIAPMIEGYVNNEIA